MAFMELEDLTGSVSVTIFSRVLEQASEALQEDRVILLRGKVDTRRRSNDGGETEQAAIVADQVWAFEDPDPTGWSRNQQVHVRLQAGTAEEKLQALGEVIGAHPGPDQVVLHVEDERQTWDLDVPGWSVNPGVDLQLAVDGLLGAGAYTCEVLRRRAPERKQWTREKETTEPVLGEPVPAG